eukprot:m.21079 g.21079  ORF g.21079 m.21079 type:complete len:385 (-) comp7025_c0_seq1:159-1313(-)
MLISLLVAVVGGFFMGLYPLFIKTPAVLAADVHPVVFQLYKSSVVCLTGFVFLIPRAVHGELPTLEFSYWGVVSAAFWVPSGLLTIGSVPLIGMGMQMAISCASNSILSFMVFWLVFDSKMKEYSCGHGCIYYRAPLYLATTVLGMLALIFSRQIATMLGCEKKKEEAPEKKALLINEDGTTKIDRVKEANNITPAKLILGIVLSLACGIFAAGQYATLTIGKKFADKKNNCTLSPNKKDDCPRDLHEGFDVLGSWWVSFGCGAVAVTLILYTIVSIQRMLCGKGEPGSPGRLPPSLHWNTLKSAGVAAGCCWVVGNFFITLATVLGGNAIIMAQSLSAQLITSGLFGILWYGEGGGTGSKIFWFFAVIWTLVSMVLLGLEKQK